MILLGFCVCVCVCVCGSVLPLHLLLIGIGLLCGSRKQGGEKAKERLGERQKVKGGLTKSNDGESSDQRRERGRRRPLHEIGVTGGKMKTLRGEVRVKGRR